MQSNSWSTFEDCWLLVASFGVNSRWTLANQRFLDWIYWFMLILSTDKIWFKNKKSRWCGSSRWQAICEFNKRTTKALMPETFPHIGWPASWKIMKWAIRRPRKITVLGLVFLSQNATFCCLFERLANGFWTPFGRPFERVRLFGITGTGSHAQNVAFFTGSNGFERVWNTW